MKAQLQITMAIFWAAAMLSAAILKAPISFTLFVLPCLSSFSLAAIEIITRRTPTRC